MAEPTLGLDIGGIQSAEALLWARYFMYSQVYFHPVRRIYDIHLADFLEEILGSEVDLVTPDAIKPNRRRYIMEDVSYV